MSTKLSQKNEEERRVVDEGTSKDEYIIVTSRNQCQYNENRKQTITLITQVVATIFLNSL